jgi:hypothetical protein
MGHRCSHDYATHIPFERIAPEIVLASHRFLATLYIQATWKHWPMLKREKIPEKKGWQIRSPHILMRAIPLIRLIPAGLDQDTWCKTNWHIMFHRFLVVTLHLLNDSFIRKNEAVAKEESWSDPISKWNSSGVPWFTKSPHLHKIEFQKWTKLMNYARTQA